MTIRREDTKRSCKVGGKRIFLSVILAASFISVCAIAFAQEEETEEEFNPVEGVTLDLDVNKGFWADSQDILETDSELAIAEEEQSGRSLSNRTSEYLRKIVKDLDFTLTLEEEYNDNIYKKSSNEEADFITRANLGINYRPDFTWGKGHGTVTFETKGGPVSYTSRDTDSDEEDFSSKVLIDYTRQKYYIGLGYGFVSTRSLGSEVSTTANDDTAEYWRDYYTLKIGTNWRKIPWEIEYREENTAYDEDYQSSDVLSKVISLTQYFSISPKTYFLLNYKREKEEYPNRNNGEGGKADIFSLGIKGKISSKITGVVTFGEQIYKPDTEEEDKKTEVVSMELDYKITKRLSAGILATKGIVATEYETEDYVTTDSVSLQLDYLPPFSPKSVFMIKGTFEDEDYMSGRRDKTYSYGLGVKHYLREWLSVVGGYRFTERKSDVNSQEYTNNIFIFKIISTF